MIAGNHLRGDLPLAGWAALAGNGAELVDVRDADEFVAGHIPGAINLPLNPIRQRLGELPRDREVWPYCGVGQRAYYATRRAAAARLQSEKSSRRLAHISGPDRRQAMKKCFIRILKSRVTPNPLG
jgi:rhodanese-related sulfurtransferase